MCGESRDVIRFQLFLVAGVCIAGGAGLLWGLGAALLAWGVVMIVFRFFLDFGKPEIEEVPTTPTNRMPDVNSNEVVEL